jgi:hypothetical protein
LEAFAEHYFTRDGRHILAGGFCEDSAVSKCRDMLSSLSSVSCVSSLDCVVVDAWLSRQTVSMVPSEMKLLAATIQIPGCRFPCGGILGDPHEAGDSANASVVCSHGMYVFALPGSIGVALRCSREKASFLYGRARRLFSRGVADSGSLICFSSDVARLTREYLLVSDGSGGSTGCLFIRGRNNSSSLWL